MCINGMYANWLAKMELRDLLSTSISSNGAPPWEYAVSADHDAPYSLDFYNHIFHGNGEEYLRIVAWTEP